jgi:hypothetical protein
MKMGLVCRILPWPPNPMGNPPVVSLHRASLEGASHPLRGLTVICGNLPGMELVKK